MTDMASFQSATDPQALILFTANNRDYWVSPGTIMQCLQIAANEHRIPALEPEWLARAVPEGFHVEPRAADEILPTRPSQTGDGR